MSASPPPDPAVLWVPCPDTSTALTIARTMVECDLAACANLIPGGTSIFPWNGEVQTSEEVYLLIKTTYALVPIATRKLEALHPYACPCILLLGGSGANEAWLRWLHATLPTSS